MAESHEVWDGDGWVVRLRDDRIRRPGHPEDDRSRRLVLEHPGAAIVLALDDDDRVLVPVAVPPPRRRDPASSCRPGCSTSTARTPLEVARRELRRGGGARGRRLDPPVLDVLLAGHLGARCATTSWRAG